MKLNYTVNLDKFEKKDEKEKDSIKNKTKLSMQSTVSNALASRLPSAPAQASIPTENSGWSRSN